MSSVLSKEKNVLGGPLLACSYAPLTNRVEEDVERCGELLLDFDVPDRPAAIPVLEVGHLLAVGVERVVVLKHWVAFDVAGIGGSESCRIRVH